MQHFFSIVFALSLLQVACTSNEEINISNSSIAIDKVIVLPNNSVDFADLDFDNKRSIWTLDGELFSGYASRFFEDSIVKEKIGFLEGKKENQATLWYPDGHFRQVANYHNGKLDGVKKVWSQDSDHVLISQLNYHQGKPHGEQKKWYPTGELYKKLNLNMGREEGLQQAFRKNGDLYANYEAKEGRIFGLKKAALCFGLEDEKIKYEN